MVCDALIEVQQPNLQEQDLKGFNAGAANVLASVVASNQQIVHFNWEKKKQAKRCLQTLVSALAEDPVNHYFSGSGRVKFCKEEVKGYLKALPDAANFIATSDSMAVALWQLLPQETPRNELWAGWTRILRVSPRKWRQLLKLELRYEHAHDEAAKAWGTYYYLSFIGSRPEARGKGYGSLLLSHITHRADAEGRWCMLEATSERSQALYARHGFITYESYRPSKKAPPVFLMKRAPQAPVPLATVPSTPLSAAALRLLQNNKGCLSGSSSPGSECGYSTKSSLISAVVRGHDAVESDSDSDSGVSDIEEGCESSGSELEQKVEPTTAPADAGVIIRSNSSALGQKDKLTAATASDDGLAAAAAAWTLASQNGAAAGTGDEKQQQLESSSNLAGAGGPNDAAAGSA